MADILPFIGTRYNSQLIGNLNKVLAPPYDVISPDMQDELHARHANNVVRLILGKDEQGDDTFTNKYTRAANTLRTWRSDGMLIEDNKPSIYLYEQEFKLPTGEIKRRAGFFALVKLEDYSSGGIKAHEHTFEGPKADRLKLMHSTNSNLSPILVIYHDKEQMLQRQLDENMREKPWEEFKDDDGVIHKLWVSQKKEFIMSLRDWMKSQKLFIADGHHRYESALNYRNERREETGKCDRKQPFDYMMMFCTSAEQDGLVIMPTHRVLTRQFMTQVSLAEAVGELKESFDFSEGKINISRAGEKEGRAIQEKVEKMGRKRPSFAMLLGSGNIMCMSLKKGVNPAELIDDDELASQTKQLDVSILHHYIINQVFVGNPEFELDDDECYYVRDIKRIFDLLRGKKASLAFIMNATPMEQVLKVVSAGIKMPHKSTCFYPKLISGLVIRIIDLDTDKPKALKH
ncbi:MAG: DUF1015 domain-containing protein [bacterium]|nr:DUF1015 domain-containing protein [Candidatus Sumerlaeota bacterium]